MRNEQQPPLVGIDIGTSKIAVLLADTDEAGALHILGATRVPSAGLRQGAVVNLDAAAAAIAEAVARAEDFAGQRIEQAFVAIGGAHVSSLIVSGGIVLSGEQLEVGPEDIGSLMAAVRQHLPLDETRELLHMLPREYRIDGQGGINNPLGMVAGRIEVDVHLISAAASHTQNLLRCLGSAGVEEPRGVGLPLGLSLAVPTVPRGDLCTVVVDLGAETTTVAVRVGMTLWHSCVLPMGAAALTRDLALALRLPVETAETLKCRFGHCVPEQIADDELIDLHTLTQTDEVTPRQLVAAILHEGASQLALRVREALLPLRHEGIAPAQILLTGGGAALPGLPGLFAAITGTPCDVASSPPIDGLNALPGGPSLNIAAGLLLWGARSSQPRASRSSQPLAPAALAPGMLATLRRAFASSQSYLRTTGEHESVRDLRAR